MMKGLQTLNDVIGLLQIAFIYLHSSIGYFTILFTCSHRINSASQLAAMPLICAFDDKLFGTSRLQGTFHALFVIGATSSMRDRMFHRKSHVNKQRWDRASGWEKRGEP